MQLLRSNPSTKKGATFKKLKESRQSFSLIEDKTEVKGDFM